MIKPLIYNSDIKAIKKKADKGSISPDEANLLRQENLSESQIQQACRRIFLSRFALKADALFMQLDNGGKMSETMRKRKGREGTVKGAPDVALIGTRKRFLPVEFKKIGSPAEIDPTPEQKEVHQFLKDCGFPVYLTNNTVYFEKIICEEFASL